MKRFHVLAMVACGALAACSGADTAAVDEERVGEAAQEITTNCVWLDPAVTPPLPIPVNFARELLIRALPVVEDPCRTTWFAACPPASLGAWTFRRLMMNMAGTVPVQQFVADWLHQWEIGTAVGPFPVPPRPGIRPAFIDPWLIASGCAAGAPIVGPGACPLNLLNAPFRLLAIVNRADNATFVGGAPPTPDPEARFVFGMTNATTGAALPSTVIFEYKLPPTRPAFGPTTLFNWASAFHVLSDAAATGPIGSPPYLLTLQPILDDITAAGAIAGNPNLGSAIGQVRTNEIAFGGPVWKMREFHLVDIGAGPNASRLRAQATGQTPDDSLNLTAGLNAYLFPNSIAGGSAALSTFTHVVPAAMEGGESTAPMLWNWAGPTPLTPLERTNFGFATCNGCHTVETNTAFTHISPRAAGVVAALSPIMSQTTVYSGVAGLPAGTLNVPDPAPTGAVFQYNEPWRRVCEVSAILGGAAGPYTRGNGM